MELPYKIGLISLINLVFVISFGWLAFPKIMEYKIRTKMTLEQGSDIRKMWEKFPYPITCKMYLFNVTNPHEVHEGGKPMLDEIGPYVFEEWREKVNIVDNDTDDSVAFNPVTRWIFNASRSGRFTGNEIVTILHPVISGILLGVERDKPAMLNIAYKAIRAIFNDPSTLFISVPAKNILFEGIYIDCNTQDFFAKSVCSQMKKEKSLKRMDEHGLLFSFMGFRNGTPDARMKVLRGIKGSKDVNRVVEYKNKSELSAWATKECNQISGTEGSIFAPLISEGESLFSFSTLLCRPLELYWIKSGSYHDLPASTYTATLGDMSTNAKEKCYCPTETNCLKKGAVDLKNCIGSPLVATLPHFYDSDDSYLDGVRGLHPEKEKHGIELLFEPMSGTPLKAKTVIQLNYFIKPFSGIEITQNLSKALLPMLWIEESIELDEGILNTIESTLYRFIYINNVVKWFGLIASIIGIILAAYMFMHRKRSFSLSTMFLTSASTEIKEPKKDTIISTLSVMAEKNPQAN